MGRKSRRVGRRQFVKHVALALTAPAALACTRTQPPVERAEDAVPTPLGSVSEPVAKAGDVSVNTGTAQTGKAKVGINLAGMADWNTELPFVDVFRMSRDWISQRQGAGFGQGPALQLDADGWVKRLEPGCWAETPLCGVSHAPAGEWTVLHDGVGQIELFGDILGQASFPGRVVFRTRPGAAGGFFLRVMRTDPANPVRNIRVLMPGFATSYEREPFHPAFLARWRGMACLRFMDFMDTNNAKVRTWSERPRPSHATFAGRGVPVELLVDLANRLGIAPWFSMPHLADDDYVRNFARYVKEHLREDLPVYVEYSNEVWNSMFEQHRYAAEQGKSRRFSDDDFTAAMAFYGLRSVEMFKLWEQAFGGRSRLVRVLGSQAGNAQCAERILSFRDVGKQADALAIAPYISFNADAKRADEAAGWDLDRLFAHLEKEELPVVKGWIQDNKAQADRFGLKLIAYEGGQHLVGVLGGENNERAAKLFMSANADARMGRLYQRYHQLWSEAGGGLFCHFSSVSSWSKWGSWGLLKEYDDDPRSSPKFLEVMRWARQCGQNVVVPG